MIFSDNCGWLFKLSARQLQSVTSCGMVVWELPWTYGNWTVLFLFLLESRVLKLVRSFFLNVTRWSRSKRTSQFVVLAHENVSRCMKMTSKFFQVSPTDLFILVEMQLIAYRHCMVPILPYSQFILILELYD